MNNMTIQRSDCCKATIDLDKTKERPECYTCSKCGRIIGSPLPQPTMNQIPNIEEEKSDCELYEHIPEPYDVAFWHCKVCGKELYFDTIESLTKTHSDTVDKTTELLTLHLPSLDKSVIRDTISVALHQQLQKAREEERERIEAVFQKHVPPHPFSLEDGVWLKRLLNKAFGHENIH